MESKVEYQTEPTPDLSPPSDPALQYVIDKWGYIGEGDKAAIVIEGHVRAMTCEWQLKRGDFNQESIRGYVALEFGEPGNMPFKCDIVVRHPEAEVAAADGDLGIVGQVFKRLGREFDLAVTEVAVQHMQTLYLDIPDKETPNKRVDAKKEVAREEVL